LSFERGVIPTAVEESVFILITDVSTPLDMMLIVFEL